MDHHWTAILNPVAGGGKGRRRAGCISSLLRTAGLSHEVHPTAGPGHARELAAAAVRRGARRILAIGGDGTLHEVANGILQRSSPGAPEAMLGILPLGTGNDWARSLGIPRDLGAAVEVLRRARTLLSDVGTVRCVRQGAEQHAHFLNVAGMGFDAFVCDRLRRKGTGGAGGRWHYLREAVFSLPAYAPARIHMELPEETLAGDCFLLALGIGRYYGGGMNICPQAQLDDGLLDLTLIEPIPFWRALRNVPRLFAGSFVTLPSVHQFRADRASVRSGTPLLVTCDGEVVGEAPAVFGIQPGALRVVVG